MKIAILFVALGLGFLKVLTWDDPVPPSPTTERESSATATSAAPEPAIKGERAERESS